MKKRTYSTPSMVKFGDVVKLTMGVGGVEIWDIGSGFKAGGGDHEGGPAVDNP